MIFRVKNIKESLPPVNFEKKKGKRRFKKKPSKKKKKHHMPKLRQENIAFSDFSKIEDFAVGHARVKKQLGSSIDNNELSVSRIKYIDESVAYQDDSAISNLSVNNDQLGTVGFQKKIDPLANTKLGPKQDHIQVFGNNLNQSETKMNDGVPMRHKKKLPLKMKKSSSRKIASKKAITNKMLLLKHYKSQDESPRSREEAKKMVLKRPGLKGNYQTDESYNEKLFDGLSKLPPKSPFDPMHLAQRGVQAKVLRKNRSKEVIEEERKSNRLSSSDTE